MPSRVWGEKQHPEEDSHGFPLSGKREMGDGARFDVAWRKATSGRDFKEKAGFRTGPPPDAVREELVPISRPRRRERTLPS